MRTIAEVAQLLGVKRDAIRRWTYDFSSYLSANAVPSKGNTRWYDESDLGILVFVCCYFELESEEDVRVRLDANEHKQGRFADFARLHTPIFREDRPEGIDVYGPLGWARITKTSLADQVYVARVYKTTGDLLVEEALSSGSYELDYAIFYAYRHMIELYLKVAVEYDPARDGASHHLVGLMEKLERHLGHDLPDWIKARINDFHQIDKGGDVFRYAETNKAIDEVWIDLKHLKAVMHFLYQEFESLIRDKSFIVWHNLIS